MGNTTPLALGGKGWFTCANLLLVWRSRCPGRPLSLSKTRHSDGKVTKCWEDCNSVNMCLVCRISITQWFNPTFKSCVVNQKMISYYLSVCVERAGPCSRHCPRNYELTAPIYAAFLSLFESRVLIWNPTVSISRVRSLFCHWPWQILRCCLALTCISHLTSLCPRSL